MDMNIRHRVAAAFNLRGPVGLLTPGLLRLCGIIFAVAWLILLCADG